MKVIGLINKIYEGTQPRHIRLYNEDWYWNDYDGYVTKESLKTTPDAQIYLFDRYRPLFSLDKEVEIIEEDKKIEKFFTYYNDDLEEYIVETKINGNRLKEHFGSPYEQMVLDKINEIIDYINNKD